MSKNLRPCTTPPPCLSSRHSSGQLGHSLHVILLALLILPVFAQDVAPPADPRRAPSKDLDGYVPFRVPATRVEWEKRAEEVRKRILISQGLFPFPTKTPLNAVVHGPGKSADLETLIHLNAPRPVLRFKTDAERTAAIGKLINAP